MNIKSIVAIGAILAFAACSNATDKIKDTGDKTQVESMVNNEGAAAFEWEEEFHDFGDIPEGPKVETMFKFKNVGDSPLIITSAKGSCGCTAPEPPKAPIAPGETGEIKVVFDSSGRAGKQDKTVTIEANTVPRTTVLKITSNVIPAAATATN